MRITQGTFSYLPDLTDEQIAAQLRYALGRGWAIMIERTDDLYRTDGSMIVSVPVTGVAVFRDDRIAEWRDYCVDWYSDYAAKTAQGTH